MLAGLAGALRSEDIKRLLAYSTVASIGYIILGFGFATPTSIYGALAYITNHMLFKGGLFLIAGALILRVNTRQMHKMGGLLKQMPLTAVCFMIMALAISGVPLLNGYLSKELIYQGAVQKGYPVYFSVFGIDFTIFAIVGWLVSILMLYCFMRAFYLIFLGKPKEEHQERTRPTHQHDAAHTDHGPVYVSLSGSTRTCSPGHYNMSLKRCSNSRTFKIFEK